MKSAPTIDLELRASRTLRLGVGVVAALAVLGIAWSGAAWGLQLLLVALALVLAWRADMRLRSARGMRLVLAPEGDWTVATAAGAEPHCVLVHSAELGPLLALTLGGKVSRHQVVLMPDSCDPQELRRVRVWLRHGHADAQKPLPIQ